MLHHDPPQPRRRSRGRFLKIAGVIVGLTVLAIAHAQIGNARLRRAVREARERGEPATMQEVLAARQAWPDERNGAYVFETIAPALSTLVVESKVPGCVLGADRGWPELGTPWPVELRDAAAELLQSRVEELAAIDRVGGCDGGRFEKRQPLAGGTPRFAPVGELGIAVRLMSLQMIHRVSGGETDRVAQDLETIHALSRLLSEEPSLLAALAWIACESQAVETLERVCGLAELEDGQLARIDRVLAGIATTRHLPLAFLAERAELLTMRLGPSIPVLTSIATFQRARAYDAVGGLIEAAKATDGAAGVAKGIEADAPEEETITEQLVGAFTRSIEIEAGLTAQARCARVAIAAERYRLKHGAWPEAPAALVPGLLAELPIDPFNGRPLQYLVNEHRLVAYSVGYDLKDDGGAVTHVRRADQVRDSGFILLSPQRRGRGPGEPDLRTTEDGASEGRM